MNAPATLLTLAFFAVAVPVVAAERTITPEPARELRICVDPDNPPLSQNRVGALPGFDVEIGQAIAERLELRTRLVWVDTTYGGKALRRTLLTGQCDVFMGLPLDAAAGTADALSFTAPYYSTGYSLIHAKNRHFSAATDVHDGRIGVERQSGAHMRLEAIGSHLVVYGNQREVLDAVARGEVDAGAVWIPDVNRLLHGRALTLNADETGPEQRLRWNVAIGVRRADTDLRAAVSRVVGELLADGRIEAIFDRYAVPFHPPFAERRPT